MLRERASELKSLAKGTQTHLRWRVANRDSSVRQLMDPLPVEAPFAKDALATLRTTGITQMHINDIDGGEALFDEIVSVYKTELEDHKEAIERNRSAFSSGAAADFKPYMYMFEPFGGGDLRYEHPSVRFALHPQLLGIVNAYFELYARIFTLKYWYNFANPEQADSRSQLWHRDCEAVEQIKIILYMTDVDEGSGPFVYAPDTHRRTLRWKEPEHWVDELNQKRCDDAMMDRFVSRDRWQVVTGKKGSMVLTVTTGYHKGGKATTNDREIVHLAYKSPIGSGRRAAPPIQGMPRNAHPAVRFAGYDL